MAKSIPLKLPLPGAGHCAAWLPWQIRDLVLKIGSGDDEKKISEKTGVQGILSDEEEEKRRQSAKAEKYEIELRLTDVLDTLRRYESGLKRDLYRTVEFLRRLRNIG